MTSALEARQRDPVFLSQSTPTVLLSDDFVIRAATPSYLETIGRDTDELLSVNAFEAFPESPATAEAGSVGELTSSVERVLRTRRQHHLGPLRYDLPDRYRPGEFLEKRWVLVNSPIRDGDEVVGVMVRVADVTIANESLVKALRNYRDVLAAGDLRSSAARGRVDLANTFLAMAESYTTMAREVTDLRRALQTRPTIDQAKGIIMADRRCTPEEAFDLLKKLSMESNVRLADVAAAIVYQAQHGGEPGQERS
jgi:response regulator NasT